MWMDSMARVSNSITRTQPAAAVAAARSAFKIVSSQNDLQIDPAPI
jgi:hypothetical protein